MKVTCFLVLLPVFFFANACRTQPKGGLKSGKSTNGIDSAVWYGITEKYWKLTWISGDTVEWNENYNQEPHIILSKEENRVSGSGGCNRLTGCYELKKEDIISISGIGITKMACMEMKTEISLLDVLAKVNRFQMEGDTLQFYQAGVKLARFESALPK